MARVFPGSDFKDVYDARNIVSTNIEGDDYKVRRSANDKNLDPRASSEWQRKIIDNFSLASRIWKNKRNCWKDHFKRSTKEFTYGHVLQGAITKELTGYKLAINMLLSSLSNGKGNFYDPPCFCITPTDLFGEELNQLSRFIIEYEKPVKYRYDETKQTKVTLPDKSFILDKFCSATLPIFESYDKCLLNAPGCVPRDNRRFLNYRSLDTINKIVMWPDLYFDPVDDFIHGSFGLYDNDFFVYDKLKDDPIIEENPNIRGVDITLQWPYYRNDLCCRHNLWLRLYYGPYVFNGTIYCTNKPPFFDIYQGSNLIVRAGAGCGATRSISIPKPPTDLSDPGPRQLDFHKNPYPVVDGFQPHQYPPGKLYEARLTDLVFGSQHKDTCCYTFIEHWFKTNEPVFFDKDSRTPMMKFNMHSFFYYPPYLSHWWPYGAIWPEVVSSDGSRGRLVLPGGPIEILPNKSEYCFSNWLIDGYFDTFVLYEQSSPSPWPGSRVRSYIGDPACESGLGPCKENIPKINQRGFWLLDLTQEFEFKDPCCRCPEKECPGCNPLPKCPDDPTLKYIGEECRICHPASNEYYVYDYLI